MALLRRIEPAEREPPSTSHGRCLGVYQIPSRAPILDRGPEIMAGTWTLLALATLFLAARIAIKTQRSRKLWWDDWILLLSWICFIATATISQLDVNLGLGKYPCDIEPQNFTPLVLLGNIGKTVGIVAVVWSKTSFALTLLRLTEGSVRAFIWFLIASMNIITCLQGVFTWVQCTPIAKSFDAATPGTCWKREVANGYDMFSSIYMGLVNLMLVMLAWYVIWPMHIYTAEKVGVAVAMSMGVSAAVTSFLRASQNPIAWSDNFTYDGSRLVLWSAADIGTTIMAACIPVLRALIRDVHTRRQDRISWFLLTFSRSRHVQGDSVTGQPAADVGSHTVNKLEPNAHY